MQRFGKNLKILILVQTLFRSEMLYKTIQLPLLSNEFNNQTIHYLSQSLYVGQNQLRKLALLVLLQHL